MWEKVSELENSYLWAYKFPYMLVGENLHYFKWNQWKQIPIKIILKVMENLQCENKWLWAEKGIKKTKFCKFDA